MMWLHAHTSCVCQWDHHTPGLSDFVTLTWYLRVSLLTSAMAFACHYPKGRCQEGDATTWLQLSACAVLARIRQWYATKSSKNEQLLTAITRIRLPTPLSHCLHHWTTRGQPEETGNLAGFGCHTHMVVATSLPQRSWCKWTDIATSVWIAHKGREQWVPGFEMFLQWLR